MKARGLITAGILLMSMTMGTMAEGPKSAAAKLNEATVYYRGAVLQHTATVTLDKGDNEVWLEGLCSGIDESSLKIGMSGGAIITADAYVPRRKTDKAADAGTQRVLGFPRKYEKKMREIGIATETHE